MMTRILGCARSHAAGGLAAALTVALAAGPVSAQEASFAGKQIEIIVPFALILGVLLVRPNGLFGRNIVERV